MLPSSFSTWLWWGSPREAACFGEASCRGRVGGEPGFSATCCYPQCALLCHPGSVSLEKSIFCSGQFCTLVGHKLCPAHGALNLRLPVPAHCSQTPLSPPTFLTPHQSTRSPNFKHSPSSRSLLWPRDCWRQRAFQPQHTVQSCQGLWVHGIWMALLGAGGNRERDFGPTSQLIRAHSSWVHNTGKEQQVGSLRCPEHRYTCVHAEQEGRCGVKLGICFVSPLRLSFLLMDRGLIWQL